MMKNHVIPGLVLFLVGLRIIVAFVRLGDAFTTRDRDDVPPAPA
jgi:hypothetical protein